MTTTIGNRIKAERDARGWSQQQLAKRAGVSQQLITRLETGKTLETKRIVQFAKAFGMTAEELQGGASPPTAIAPEQLVHRVCDFLRRERDELECNKCPLKVTTQYGPGTVGCVLRAEELINIVRGSQT